jgi:HD superfamily phosphodiesterase
MPNYINERWELLSEFVNEVCSDRDKSHGWEHMKTVAENSLKIIVEDFKDLPESTYNQLVIDTITVAWLHDVADHKYDKDGHLTNILIKWGYRNITGFCNILEIIKLVSFSSENNAILQGKPINYDEILGKHYATVRHIVSDADKLEAIGLIGMERAIGYTQHAHPEYSERQIIADVKKHADEKLLRLAGEFIRTPTGKQIAQLRHCEMKSELDRSELKLRLSNENIDD